MQQRTVPVRLFTVCLGVFAGTAFCMKWMESDLVSGGRTFSIIGVELTYGATELRQIFTALTEPARTALGYHLVFDYLFMAAVYPGIAILCLWARDRYRNPGLRIFLTCCAIFQAFAWAIDVYENRCISRWMAAPDSIGHLRMYHALVTLKWVIAVFAFLTSLLLLARRRRSTANRT